MVFFGTNLIMKYNSKSVNKIQYYFSHDGYHCTLSMIDLGLFFSLKKSSSEVFGRIKLHKKGTRNIYFFLYLRKLSRLTYFT